MYIYVYNNMYNYYEQDYNERSFSQTEIGLEETSW